MLSSILFITLSGCDANRETLQGQAQLEIVESEGYLGVSENHITDIVKLISLTVDEVTMEIMFVRATNGDVRVALNTCEICYASGKGYFVQDASAVICQNCDMSFDIDYIGLSHGGCQPIPIEYFLEEDYVIITYGSLLENIQWFIIS